MWRAGDRPQTGEPLWFFVLCLHHHIRIKLPWWGRGVCLVYRLHWSGRKSPRCRLYLDLFMYASQIIPDNWPSAHQVHYNIIAFYNNTTAVAFLQERNEKLPVCKLFIATKVRYKITRTSFGEHCMAGISDWGSIFGEDAHERPMRGALRFWN